MRKRILTIFIIFILLFTSLVIRLGYITFISADKITKLANELWKRDIPVQSDRGIIYDRNGEVLAGNKLAYTVASINKQITDKDYTATILSNILNCDKNKILKHINKNNSIEIIKPEGRRISFDQAQRITNANLDGIYLTADSSRYYPYNETLAQVLGFCGIDMDGLSGIEYRYNDYLKSQKGALSIYTDAKGNLMHDTLSVYEKATPGLDIYLTIDINIQLILDNIINIAIEAYNPEQVMGLVVNAKTGEVLAMTSYPYFNPNNYQDYDESIYNRNLPIFYSFELGSTFKIFTYSVALELGLVDINEFFYCKGYTTVADRRLKCWKKGGHGSQTFLEAIQNSCNPAFVELGRRIGIDNFYKYLDLFGYTSKTGIDLTGEQKGITMAKSLCGPVELATQAFGQTSAYTPIQLVMSSISAINGGNLYQPYILKEIRNYTDDVLYEKEPIIKNKTISEKTSNIMKYALECVTALGTGRNAFIEGYRVGSKTGTAQKISPSGGYLSGEYILSTLGIAPMNNPEIAVYIAIDNPKGTNNYGGTVVSPLVGQVIEQSLNYLKIPRDYDNQIEKNLRWFLDTPTYKVPNYIGKTKKEIKQNQFYKYIFYGEGNTVIYQSPNPGEKIKEGDTIMFYLG